jgi:hypothetical protein
MRASQELGSLSALCADAKIGSWPAVIFILEIGVHLQRGTDARTLPALRQLTFQHRE